MKEKKLVEAVDYLKLDKKTLNAIYQHVWFLANFRFARPIMVLQTRHKGYDKEDFVQEVVQLVCKLFDTMKFPTINHLKKMIKNTMSWHYLHEKRKYFYTKARGNISCVSLDDDVNEYRTMEDTIATENSINNETIYDLHRLFERNLYLAYDWNKAIVIAKDQIKDYAKHCILSVNFFIKLQKDYGFKDTCRFYKSKGFYMTKTTFDYLSQTIIDYLKINDIILVEDIKEPVYVRPRTRHTEEQIETAKYTCTCGYTYREQDFDSSSWQCPLCGRIHDKTKLKDYNLGLTKDYNAEISEVFIIEKPRYELSKKPSIEETRINLIKLYENEFNDILFNKEDVLEEPSETSKDLVLA